MSVAEQGVKSMVLGRRFFIDLWSIMGMVPVLCEDPRELTAILPEILSRKDIACVMIEEHWFYEVPVSLRTKLEDMMTPLWVSLPTLMIGEEGV